MNRSITNSHLYIGIITSLALVLDSQGDVETFKLFDVKCPVRVEHFQLHFLPELLVSSAPLQTVFVLFFRGLAVQDVDQAQHQNKILQELHLLKDYLFKRLIKFTKE